ncbi:MAG: NAD(P)H-binding protein [Myxococcales bacterium]|nr:NAD(P)H-binding protein [Myxococcales bacterium]
MTILINTPNGNIGRPLAEALLAAGESLVLIQRDASKVADLAARGAKVVEGSVDDPVTLARAFEGVDAVFWLTPPTYRPDFHDWAVQTAKAAAAAAQKQGVSRVVVLSSVGAHNDGNGPVSILRHVEDAFRAALPNVLALRPAYFMENFLGNVASFRDEGAWYMPVAGDKKMPLVATRDIAAVAAEELRAPFEGHRYRGVHGPADVSMNEVAQALTGVLEKPVAFVSVPLDAALGAMRESGAPDFVVDLFRGLLEGLSNGRMDPAEPRDASTTTPTSIATFAREVLRPAVAG